MLKLANIPRKLQVWLAIIASAVTILLATQQFHCASTPTPTPSRVKVTRTAEVRSRPDTVWVHDTLLTRIYLKARGNSNRPLSPDTLWRDSLSSFSSLACLDSLIQSGDTTAAGPDTVSICHDPATNWFWLDLRLAPRTRILPGPYVHEDSIIHERDTATVVGAESLGDKAIRILEFAAVAIVGVVFGAVMHL